MREGRGRWVEKEVDKEEEEVEEVRGVEKSAKRNVDM